MDALNIKEILTLLPHRYPFLLIDRVIHWETGKIIAIKNVTANEPFFVGHFPERPIMPGVLILEAMAQAAAVLAYKSHHLKKEDATYLFAGIDNARFRRIVEPGDQLRVEVNFVRAKLDILKLTGAAYVGEELACSADLISAKSKNEE